jgi:hypothetical protein
MTDRYKVYTKVLKSIKEIVKDQHPGHTITLAMMIAGIVMSKKAQLSEMSSEIPTKAKDKSIEMRLRRWVKHERIDGDLIYLPFAQEILSVLSAQRLLLVMDGSQVGRGCMVLMVGVVYKKRSLPIAWLVYKGKKGHTTAERHIEVLEKVNALLPENAQVVLMGDAEYDTTEMVFWLQENTNWDYVLRTSPQIYVSTGLEEDKISSLPLKKDQVLQYLDVKFTQKAKVNTNLVLWWTSKYEKPIYLISSIKQKYLACRLYQRRYRIETFFSDQKSRGFNIHKSHLSDPQRLSRLLVAASLAYLWMIRQGLKVVAEGKTALIDRTERNDKSIFRLGMDWLRYCLKRNLDFEPMFIFRLEPDLVNVR